MYRKKLIGGLTLPFVNLNRGVRVEKMTMRRRVSHLSKQALQGAQVDYYFYPSSRVSRDFSVSLVNLYVSFVCVLCAFMVKSGRSKGMKFQLKANVFLENFAFEMNKMVQVDMWFPTGTYSVLSPGVLIDRLNSVLRDVEARFDSFVERGSGWVVKKVLQFCLTVNSFKLFKGGCKKGSFLPGRLRTMQSCITIDSPPNSDSDRCF